MPRCRVDREAGKHFFFEKKKQKTFDYFGFGPPGETEAEFARFFLKKNHFLNRLHSLPGCIGQSDRAGDRAVSRAACDILRVPVALERGHHLRPRR
jgi:hypothetical protein